ncbi:MAG: S46 family peptidase [Vulcanimicrobiota bacterium]
MKKTLAIILTTLLLASTPAPADEGMWLYSDPPSEQLRQKYGFELTSEWLDRLRLSSVRFNNGGSGSFISSQGLVLTNHHVGADAIQKLSTPERDLMKTGFLATSHDQELKTRDLELNVLVSTEDVTKRVKSAVKPEMTAEEASAAQDAVMARIEKESMDSTGLRSDVVTLFRGGAYHLYRYKKYTDVRLVFAPEIGIAFYGGDTDNFEYPRYCLDMALFRVYENELPVNPKEFLRISDRPLKEGDLTFVSGHPGRTERLNTSEHLKFLRDVRYPLALRTVRRAEVLLRTFSERGPEFKRRAQDDLFGYQNARKAYLGGLEGLQNPDLLQAKKDREARVRKSLQNRPELKQKYGDPYADIRRALEAYREIYPDYYLIGGGRAFNTRLFDFAETIHRYQQELSKPNEKRLREFNDSNLDSLKQQLFSEAPLYDDLEQAKLADSLSYLMEMRGADDPLVQQIMAGKSPGVRASELVRGTRLDEVPFRREALQGATSDPMLELAEMVDEEARRLRKRYEEEVGVVLEDAYGRLAQLEYELGTTAGYPDATFTLRLAYGPVQGYRLDGESVPAFTTLEGLYEKGERFEQQDPYKIPDIWIEARGELALDTPFNFVSTPDITGGNSGSPVVDRQGELVGLIFDGNIQSLVLDFQFEEVVARAVSVDVRAMREALKKVYNAPFLVEEMGR